MKRTKGRPRQKNSLMVNAGIALDQDLIKSLDTIARLQGVNRSELVRSILEDYLVKQSSDVISLANF